MFSFVLREIVEDKVLNECFKTKMTSSKKSLFAKNPKKSLFLTFYCGAVSH